jgi:hypothetical protein
MKTIKGISILLLSLLAMSVESSKIYAQVTFSVGVTVQDAPPPLPVYAQPPCPIDGYLWVPGYWAYTDGGYYWVPGVWVSPPQPNYLWTPCYWGFSGGYYGFHAGYWGQHIGYYGGVNYGYGYGGNGYNGGRWEEGRFRYNTAVVNVNRSVVRNTYVDRAAVSRNNNHTSFNGPGGVNAKPTSQQEVSMRETHVPPTSEQTSHQQVASKDRNQFVSVNKGRPATAAMNKVGGQSFNPQGRTPTAATSKPEARLTTEATKPATRPTEPNKPAVRPANTNQAARPAQPQQQARPATKQPQPARPAKQPQQQARPASRPQDPRPNQENHEPQQGGEGREKRN